ncbi:MULTISPECIES: PEP-CTERM sorting domain-containing protein [Limnospira]|uniref:Ice-binding protein C-terminal domain-containing protein n=1 Tax=Limnospira indica PCC 8005 TaxID=376219 RepID=A0A9P1KJF9_9CYAN|nr:MULTISPECIES: PEP-CTERM sorting domain-containing protein [Limnospira]MDT9276259.1 PEP-CTERM sorting domain-containing protein [Limnospira sp. PMC 737.11]CDM97418.1 conserved exported protein of unknown function [Limnospira indica PCC 8005]
MKNLCNQIALSAGVTMVSAIALATPSHAATFHAWDVLANRGTPNHRSVFYDLEFFDHNGNLLGTGELIHAGKPFEGIIDMCVTPWCRIPPLDIKKEDNFFLVQSFSSPIPGLGGAHFFRPFDEQLLAGFLPCTSAGCIANTGGIGFTYNSWVLNVRTGFNSRMTANEWSVSGSSIPQVPNGSGTWTATRRATVPEPTSILGFLGLGVLGTVSLLKRHGS